MAVFTGNGTNTAPSFTFSSDTNTGIYRRNADELAFVTAGAECGYFDSSQQLGLGMVPTAKLSVNGGIDIPSTNVINLGSDQGGGATLGYASGGTLDIIPRSTYRARIIGTAGAELRRETNQGDVTLFFNSADSGSTQKDVAYIQADNEATDGWGLRFAVRPNAGPTNTTSGFTRDGEFWTGNTTLAGAVGVIDPTGGASDASTRIGGAWTMYRNATLANTGSDYLDVALPGSFTGHVHIVHSLLSNAAVRTHAAYYVSGRLGNVFTTTLLNSSNGSSGSLGISLSYAGTANNLRVTSTYSGGAGNTSMSVAVFGCSGF